MKSIPAKNRCKYIITTLLLLLSTITSFSQGQFTTQGRDFWLCTGQNNNHNYLNATIQIRFVATENTTIKLEYTANTSINRTETVSAGQVKTITLSNAEKAAIYNSTIGSSTKSLHVTSDKDIALFALNLQINTTDASNILPITNLGTDYYHLSYKNSYTNNSGGPGDGYNVVATENNTKVYDNGTLVATLNTGGVYTRYFGKTDATGRHITSDKPIAYFVTNSCVRVPTNVAACDCLYQQLVPVPSWGNTFLVPVSNRGKDRIRIIASQNGTVVSKAGGTIVGGIGAASLNLNAGQFVELEIVTVDKGCYISSNKPVAITSYLMSMNNFTLTDAIGDPAMAWVPPIEQAVAHVAMSPFFVTGSALTKHYALIVAPTATKSITTVAIGGGADQALSGGSWTDNSASGYSYYSMPLTSTTATYLFKNSKGLTIMGYGLGNYESYYYLAAASARQLDPAFYVNEIHFQDANGQSYCDQAFTFRASIQYPISPNPGKLKWYIDGTEYMPARDKNTWIMPMGGLLGKHEIKLIITDTYNNTKVVITEFTVLPIPTTIPASDLSAATICSGTAPTVRLANTTNGLTYRVYNAATGGTLVGSVAGTGGAVNIACTGNLNSGTTYYVEKYNGVCSGPRTAVPINVTARPTVPVPTAAAICNGANPVISLPSTVSGVVYTVYTASSGGTSVGSVTGNGSPQNITLSTSPSLSTTYYVEAALGSCISTSRQAVLVTVNTVPTITNVTITHVTCNGASTGQLVVTASGANSYSKDNGATWQASGIFPNLAAGVYQIKVRNAAGCESAVRTETVTQASVVSFTKTQVNVTCNGAATGSITVTAAGGSGAGYQYSKDGGTTWQAANVFSGLVAGTYTIKVKDGNGCLSVNQTVTITQSTAVVFPAPTKTDVSCFGGNNGSVSLSASGGSGGGYQFSMNGGVTWHSSGSSVFATLAAGTYTFLARDGAGCQSVSARVVTIGQPLVTLSFTYSVTNLTCNGGANNGGINITAAGGTAPYQYSIDGGTTYLPTANFVGLTIGAYGVIVRDSKLCETPMQTAHVSQPLVISLPATFSTTNVTCNGGSDGVITANGVSGGTLPYQYSFNGGAYQAGNIKTGLLAGTHTVQVKDANGCTSVVKPITITEPVVILNPANVIALIACPNSTATITVSNTVLGVVYKVFDAATGGNLVGNGTGTGANINISVGLYTVSTTLYVETLTTGGCISVARIPVNIAVRATELDYPDIRVQACPSNTPGTMINLSKYIDTVDIVSLTWADWHSGDVHVSAGGKIDASKLQAPHTYAYKYTVSNNCVSNIERRLYITALKNKPLGLAPDTVLVCKDQAEAIQLNRIVGIDAEGTWRYIPNLPAVETYLSRSPLTSAYAGAVVFNGKAIYGAGVLTPITYNGHPAEKIEFYYKAGIGSCFPNKEYKVVIILTEHLLP